MRLGYPEKIREKVFYQLSKNQLVCITPFLHVYTSFYFANENLIEHNTVIYMHNFFHYKSQPTTLFILAQQ